MVLHHKMSQTVKIKVNRYTNIYLLMNLFKIHQFINFPSKIKNNFLIIVYFCHVDSLRLFMVQRNYIQSENINFTPIHRAESKW